MKKSEIPFKIRKKEYDRKYREKNKEKIKLYLLDWRERNKKSIRENNKKWRQENREKLLVNWTRRYQNNKERCLELNNISRKKRRRKDFKFCLDANMGRTIWQVLKGKKNKQSWIKLVGYTLNDLIGHLEKKFDDKMNWENYGSYWHIDHRIPKSWFKYKKAEDEEFKKCWALENLQPLEKHKNHKKSNYYIS